MCLSDGRCQLCICYTDESLMAYVQDGLSVCVGQTAADFRKKCAINGEMMILKRGLHV